MFFPDSLPLTVPAGIYVAEISGEVTERPSLFKQGATYLVLPMRLQDKNGMVRDFEYAFGSNLKDRTYRLLITILGGTEHPDGRISPPPTMMMKKFQIKIGERTAKNDKSRIVNEILSVSPLAETKAAAEPPFSDVEEAPF